jgi:hypothetical protein
MDINTLDILKRSADGFDVEIINPLSKKSLGVKIRIAGVMGNDCRDDFAVYLAEITDLKKVFEPKEGASAKDQAKASIEVQKAESKIQSAFLAKYTIGWSDLVENCKAVEFSYNNAERIYNEYPIIRNQVQSAMLDVSNFIQDF